MTCTTSYPVLATTRILSFGEKEDSELPHGMIVVVRCLIKA